MAASDDLEEIDSNLPHMNENPLAETLLQGKATFSDISESQLLITAAEYIFFTKPFHNPLVLRY